jgi:hypothetical protein
MKQQGVASFIAGLFPIRILPTFGALASARLLPAAAFVPPDRDAQWQTSLNGN